MNVFIKIILFILCFISVIGIIISARNLDKSCNTEYISDITISLLITYVTLKEITKTEK